MTVKFTTKEFFYDIQFFKCKNKIRPIIIQYKKNSGFIESVWWCRIDCVTVSLYEISGLIKTKMSKFYFAVSTYSELRSALISDKTSRYYHSVSSEVSLTSAYQCSMSSTVCLGQPTVFFFFVSLPLLFVPSFILPLGSSTCGVNAKTRGRPRGRPDGEVALNKCEMQKIWKRRGERKTDRTRWTRMRWRNRAARSVPAQMADWSTGARCHCTRRLQEKKNSSSRHGSAAALLVRTNCERCTRTDAIVLFIARLLHSY